MKGSLFAAALLLALPAMASAQQSHPGGQEGQGANMRIQQELQSHARLQMEQRQRAEATDWRDSLDNTAKLQSQLAAAWEKLGLAPAAAKAVAAAYDPQRASRLHHEPMDGARMKNVAGMLQDALAKKNYLKANQLLIDYQRAQLRLQGAFPGKS